MHLILPLGGRGTRMRPHSHHRPKALFRMAGRSVLGHVLDALDALPIERVTLIVGPDGRPLEEWARERMPWPVEIVMQAEPAGQSAAIAEVGTGMQGSTVVVFADTLFAIDPAALLAPDEGLDGILFGMQREDVEARGVALLAEDGRVERLIEKPREPVSPLAVMGLYWLRDGAALRGAIEAQLAAGRRRHGEFYLADALQRMIDAGARFALQPALAWKEAGNAADALDAHGWLLGRRLAASASDPTELARRFPGSRFQPPVYVAPAVHIDSSELGPGVWIEEGCRIEDSRLGPEVSLGAGSQVRASRLRHLIGERELRIEACQLDRSVLGMRAGARGLRGRLDLGDDSRVDAAGAIIAP